MANIKDMSMEQLKALAYDQIANKEQAERNLQMVNQEIANRMMAPLVPEKDGVALPGESGAGKQKDSKGGKK